MLLQTNDLGSICSDVVIVCDSIIYIVEFEIGLAVEALFTLSMSGSGWMQDARRDRRPYDI